MVLEWVSYVGPNWMQSRGSLFPVVNLDGVYYSKYSKENTKKFTCTQQDQHNLQWRVVHVHDQTVMRTTRNLCQALIHLSLVLSLFPIPSLPRFSATLLLSLLVSLPPWPLAWHPEWVSLQDINVPLRQHSLSYQIDQESSGSTA